MASCACFFVPTKSSVSFLSSSVSIQPVRARRRALVCCRSMIWMPLRSVKIYGFIFGFPPFHRMSEMHAGFEQCLQRHSRHGTCPSQAYPFNRRPGHLTADTRALARDGLRGTGRESLPAHYRQRLPV